VADGGTSTPQKGQLNPSWVEWLMGWPIGWSVSGQLEMDKFPEWLNLHGRL
jgi:DNA (cytosine-5)-methyltransferase 1